MMRTGILIRNLTKHLGHLHSPLSIRYAFNTRITKPNILNFKFNNNKNDNPKPEEPKPSPNSDDPNNDSGWKKKFEAAIRVVNKFFSDAYRKKISLLTLALGCALASLSLMLLVQKRDQQVSTSQFMNMLSSNLFKEVVFVEEGYLYSLASKVKKVQGKTDSDTYYCHVLSFSDILEKVIQNPLISFRNEERSGWDFFLQKYYLVFDVFSLIVIVGIIMASRKKMGSGDAKQMLGNLKNKKFSETKNMDIRFENVAGLNQVKREVEEIVDFLKSPEKYHQLGATIPKGVLLTGPPGTGKTLLAKACAGEAGVPFYSVSGSDFVEMYVGVGASRVRELFSQAKSKDSPAIIFIDQLDAIGKKRMNKLGTSDERESTLNQLLVEMDGFQTSNKIVVMGATNLKQVLDSALTRPGRFDRQVEVGLPDLKGRYEIFLVHLKPLKLSSKYTKQEYAKRLASLSPGFSGAEIANLCNEAAILSARQGKQVVQMIDFQVSSERVIGGVERKGFVSLTEKKTVAYHECGHAVVSWFLEGADPLLKVTIIPRSKGALGFAQYFVNQNQLQTKQELLDRICFILGGRCSELHFFNEVTTGAYDDLSKAYDLAYNIVAKFGMQEQIGYISFPNSQYTKGFSEQIESKIDKQIQKIIKQCTEITHHMVKKHEQDIKNLAEQLLLKETLDVRSIQKILGKRPFPPNKTFQAYLQTSN